MIFPDFMLLVRDHLQFRKVHKELKKKNSLFLTFEKDFVGKTKNFSNSSVVERATVNR